MQEIIEKVINKRNEQYFIYVYLILLIYKTEN